MRFGDDGAMAEDPSVEVGFVEIVEVDDDSTDSPVEDAGEKSTESDTEELGMEDVVSRGVLVPETRAVFEDNSSRPLLDVVTTMRDAEVEVSEKAGTVEATDDS